MSAPLVKFNWNVPEHAEWQLAEQKVACSLCYPSVIVGVPLKGNPSQLYRGIAVNCKPRLAVRALHAAHQLNFRRDL